MKPTNGSGAFPPEVQVDELLGARNLEWLLKLKGCNKCTYDQQCMENHDFIVSILLRLVVLN